MPTDIEPIEGNWYEALENGIRFFVVTIDEDEGIVELQHEDGAPEEISLETWQEVDLVAISPPVELEMGDDSTDLNDAALGGCQREDPENDAWGEPLPEINE